MFESKIYRHSPKYIQELLISTRSLIRNFLREGKEFSRILNEIESTQWLDRNTLKEYQFKRMVSIIRHAENHVPYYRELFNKVGLKSSDINDFEDIKRIPILTKEDVLKNENNLKAHNIKGLKIKGSTSGATGTPITIFQNLAAVVRENAFVWRQLHWAGYKKGERRAWIRGDMVVPSEKNKKPFWRMNKTDNMLMMSSYHFSEWTAPKYIDALQKFDPLIIQAYPSSIFYLAQYLENQNREYQGDNLRGILTSSETLTDVQRDVIKRQMGCPIFDYYGNGERVISIGTCEKGNYHLNSDYGFMELFPSEDRTCEMIGTGFNNWLMLLIRYKTNDLVEMSDEKFECPCGRKLPVVKRILGRMDDYIKTKDGRLIGRLDHIFKGLQNIAEAQIIQDSIEEVNILVVPFTDFELADKDKLLKNAKHRLGKDMKIQVELVTEIKRTSRGKLRNVICNV